MNRKRLGKEETEEKLKGILFADSPLGRKGWRLCKGLTYGPNGAAVCGDVFRRYKRNLRRKGLQTAREQRKRYLKGFSLSSID